MIGGNNQSKLSIEIVIIFSLFVGYNQNQILHNVQKNPLF